jgi:hypothetical protein
MEKFARGMAADSRRHLKMGAKNFIEENIKNLI